MLKQAILLALYFEGSRSLVELSAETGKSLPLVTTAVSQLVADEYVVECGLAPSTGGRRPATFSLNDRKNLFIIAIAMDQLETRCQIFHLTNKKVGIEYRLELSLLDESANTLKRLTDFISEVIKKSAIRGADFLGVGLAMPGVINIVEKVNHTFFNDIEGNLESYLSSELGIPVYIDNDSRAIALAEQKFGQAKGFSNTMVVNIGWGIGLGMIVNGQIFRGSDGYAGEFSHIPLSSSDLLCTCGKRGCLEVDASLTVCVNKALIAMENGNKSSLETLFEDESKLKGEQLLLAASQGDPLATSLIGESGFAIGKGLATLIHILNPELILLSGRGATAGRIFLAPIHQAINEFSIRRLAEHTRIVVSNLGRDAELIGASAMVIKNTDFRLHERSKKTA